MSSNGSLGNLHKVLYEHLIKHVLRRWNRGSPPPPPGAPFWEFWSFNSCGANKGVSIFLLDDCVEGSKLEGTLWDSTPNGCHWVGIFVHMSYLNTVFSCKRTVSFSSAIGFHPLCSLFHISGDRLHQTFDSSVFCNIKDSQCVNSSSPSNRFQQNRWDHAPAFCFSTKKLTYSTVSCISGGTMLILPYYAELYTQNPNPFSIPKFHSPQLLSY